MKSFSEKFKETIFETNLSNFESRAIELFQYQASENEVYKSYLGYLKIKPNTVNSIQKIPFLPIEFFKTHQVITGKKQITHTFESSGTTRQIRSKHHITDINFYYQIAEKTFEVFFTKLSDCIFFSLLPSYAERDNSSLIYMMNHFHEKSKNEYSGFYLNNYSDLINKLKESKGQKNVFLIGVSFALLELAENYNLDLSHVQILETGGMKGRRKEMIREELHNLLKTKFNVSQIGSEYGMTELLSQGYSKGNGIFETPYWLRMMQRDTDDPFSVGDRYQKRGAINVIDLANINSCAFIQTQDLGYFHPDLSFEVLGRIDNSDLRGCNLMYF